MISNELIQSTIEAFCFEFIKSPYLCYTEHGLHALFFHRLMEKIPEDERYSSLYGKNVCLVQKEYPTHTSLLKGQRQHWDIAIIDETKKANGKPEFDHLQILAAIEFGLNEGREHLKEDIRRLALDDNSESKFVVHLYRISNNESGRDIKPDSKSRYIDENEASTILNTRERRDKRVTMYYGISDRVNNQSFLAKMDEKGIHTLS